MGDPFAERSRRLSHHFAVINLIHCRLSPTQPFNKRLPTSLFACVPNYPLSTINSPLL
ncbi:MAG: hypothetical protein LBK82_05875 [Planctomycetaceae bacterium]|nr:hypothetical protein [Planctomycetaceae bacterium]